MSDDKPATPATPDPWIIIPWLVNPQMTADALHDALAQFSDTARVLLIGSGVSPEDRAWMEGEIADYGDRVLPWWHNPQLPSLSAKWNAGLRFVWATGATEALVLNADLRMRAGTYARLRDRLRSDGALFVSGVGVTKEQFEGTGAMQNDSKGGPDFSCYVISKECHDRFPFDERYVPAYLEDNDTHRKVMLAGEGDRIFSIDLPYWHIDRGSGTLKSMSPERREQVERQISDGSRAYHRAKWGGDCNEETFAEPFGAGPEPISAPGRTTRELFDNVRAGWCGPSPI